MINFKSWFCKYKYKYVCHQELMTYSEFTLQCVKCNKIIEKEINVGGLSMNGEQLKILR